MFVFFSKLILIFITPANWIIGLLIWRLFSKSHVVKKRLNIILLALVLIFGNEFLYNKLVWNWQINKSAVNNLHQYPAGIVLGGMGGFDKQKQGYLNTSSDRFIATYTLYKTGRIKKIIISAGNLDADKPKEADYLFSRFLELGIPATDLVIERDSRTTFENALYTKRKIDSLQIKQPLVLITSAIHMRRALEVFEKAGIKVIPHPCNFDVVDVDLHFKDYVFPQLNIIVSWTKFIKEVVGLAGYKLFDKA